MGERARRSGRNEAIFREVNEQIEELERGMAEISDRTFYVVCECGDLDCTERISVSIQKYERIRADSALFLVKPGHEKPDVETVVEESPAYNIVRKHPGDAEQVAEETDPRSA